MVTARIAGLSPGTSPPPVRIPITPFLVLMRPLCRFLRACKRKIDVSDWMCKRHRLDETVSRVTNSRYHANPSSDRVFFRHRSNDCIRSIPTSLTAASRLFRPCRSSQSLHSTFQRITTAKLMFRRDPIFLIIGNTIKIDASIAPIFSTGKLGLSPFPSFHVGLLRSNQHHSGLLDNFYGSLAAGGDID